MVFSKRLRLSLWTTAVLLWIPNPVFSQVVISEVMWMGSDLSASDEWVEIVNISYEPVNLDGWQVHNLKGLMIAFSDVVLEPGQYGVISNFSAAGSRLESEPLVVDSKVSLPNTKLLLQLLNASGSIIDEVDDGIGVPFAGSNPSGGIGRASMERVSLQGSGTEKGNWVTAEARVGFDEGEEIYGTPGYAFNTKSDPLFQQHPFAGAVENSSPQQYSSLPNKEESIDAEEQESQTKESSPPQQHRFPSDPARAGAGAVVPLRLSEILANPSGRDDSEWIEIENFGEQEVDLKDLKLIAGSKEYVVTTDIKLAPNQFAVFPKTQTNLLLPNTGARVSLEFSGDVIDSLDYPQTAEDVSFGRLAGEEQTVMPFCVPTYGKPNIVIKPGFFIDVQSGKTKGEGSLTINLQAGVREDVSMNPSSCVWIYGDGDRSEKCNPPSKKYEEPGEYTLVMEVRTYCGRTYEERMRIQVVGEKDLPLQQHRFPSDPARAGAGAVYSKKQKASIHKDTIITRKTKILVDSTRKDQTKNQKQTTIDTKSTTASQLQLSTTNQQHPLAASPKQHPFATTPQQHRFPSDPARAGAGAVAKKSITHNQPTKLPIRYINHIPESKTTDRNTVPGFIERKLVMKTSKEPIQEQNIPILEIMVFIIGSFSLFFLWMFRNKF